MATQLFKDGQTIWVETDRVQANIANGWSPDDPNSRVNHPEVIYPPNMGLEKLSMQEAEAKVLEAMGIEPIKVVTAEELKEEPPPVAPRVKRKYTKRK